jgi:hypothetical protein
VLVRLLPAGGPVRLLQRRHEVVLGCPDERGEVGDILGPPYGSGRTQILVVGERPARLIDTRIEQHPGRRVRLGDDLGAEFRVAHGFIAEPCAIGVDEQGTVHHRCPSQEHPMGAGEGSVALVCVQVAEVSAQALADA